MSNVKLLIIWKFKASIYNQLHSFMKWKQLPDKEQLQSKHKAVSEQLWTQITNQIGFQGLQDQHKLEIYARV